MFEYLSFITSNMELAFAAAFVPRALNLMCYQNAQLILSFFSNNRSLFWFVKHDTYLIIVGPNGFTLVSIKMDFPIQNFCAHLNICVNHLADH